ncbi:NADH-ubiquinone/plastoquinone (complex I) oxidoreductase, partial [Streptomyces sparsogenes DSM 40356]
GVTATAERAGRLFTDARGYRAAVLDGRPVAAPAAVAQHWPTTGILLGLLSTALAAALAALAVWRPARTGATALTAPVRRLQSGHIGDYVAWLVVGMALLTALTATGLR